MGSTMYTIDQIAKTLDLHPKTVRRFIREGKLKGNKVGGQWRVMENDLKVFMEGEAVSGEIKSESAREIQGSIDAVSFDRSGEKVQVSTVIDVLVEDFEEATRLSNTFIAVLNCKDPDYGRAKYNFIYYEAERKARFILWGTPLFISKMLRLVAEISK
jgi:excisionase family DNA binding protein